MKTLNRPMKATRAEVAGMLAAARHDRFRVRDLPGVQYFRVAGLGFATVRLDPARGLCMDYVWVQPPFRRCGVGRMLVAACEDYARSIGARFLHAATRADIRPLLEGRGWSPTGAHEQKLPVYRIHLEVSPCPD